jgi:hypothetical protein
LCSLKKIKTKKYRGEPKTFSKESESETDEQCGSGG